MASNKRAALALGLVGATLLVVAICIGISTWLDGQRAENAAQELLQQQESLASVLAIPSVGLELPVLWEYSDEGLQTAVCRYWGPEPGDDGHLIITGHDYLAGAHFSTLHQVETGSDIILYDRDGQRFNYRLVDTLVVTPDDMESLSQYYGPKGLTLLTCSDNANKRLLLRCHQVSPA